MARADTLTAALFSPWPGMEGQGGRGWAAPELASWGLPGVDISVLDVMGFAQRTLSTARRMLDLQYRAAEDVDIS